MDQTWYCVVGGRRQGPMAVAQLKSLLSTGQLRGSDLVWRDGMAQWSPAQAVAELGVPVRPDYRGAPSPVQGQDIGQNAGMRMLLPVGRSGLAIAAGYAGLFAFVVCPAPLALILGILAILDIRKHPEKHGMGRAIFGLVMGVLGSIVLCVAAVVRLSH